MILRWKILCSGLGLLIFQMVQASSNKPIVIKQGKNPSKEIRISLKPTATIYQLKKNLLSSIAEKKKLGDTSWQAVEDPLAINLFTMPKKKKNESGKSLNNQLPNTLQVKNLTTNNIDLFYEIGEVRPILFQIYGQKIRLNVGVFNQTDDIKPCLLEELGKSTSQKLKSMGQDIKKGGWKNKERRYHIHHLYKEPKEKDLLFDAKFTLVHEKGIEVTIQHGGTSKKELFYLPKAALVVDLKKMIFQRKDIAIKDQRLFKAYSRELDDKTSVASLSKLTLYIRSIDRDTEPNSKIHLLLYFLCFASLLDAVWRRIESKREVEKKPKKRKRKPRPKKATDKAQQVPSKCSAAPATQ